MLDEWQVFPELWNSVRREVDERGIPGQFILTGSATPSDDDARHSGAGAVREDPDAAEVVARVSDTAKALLLPHLLPW